MNFNLVLIFFVTISEFIVNGSRVPLAKYRFLADQKFLLQKGLHSFHEYDMDIILCHHFYWAKRCSKRLKMRKI